MHQNQKPWIQAMAYGAIITATAGSHAQVLDDPSDARQHAVVSGNTEFAMELFTKLCNDQTGNIFCSPYSISTALAMTFAGARGDTAEQMAQALHFDLPPGQLHQAFEGLGNSMANLRNASAGNPPRVHLSSGNRVWGQTGEPLLDSFLGIVEEHYHAGFESLDFTADIDKALRAINNWAFQQTEENVTELLRPADLKPTPVLVLTSAIYFKAEWHICFDATATQPGDFFVTEDEAVSVPMMNSRGKFRYYVSDDWQALQLPYVGERVSMVVLLPTNSDQSTAGHGALLSDQLSQILGGLCERDVDVSIPRFKLDSRLELRELLEQLGMPIAFSDHADFSGMNGRPNDLFLSKVVHQAVIEVSEEGTESSAAGGVIMSRGGSPEITHFEANRPFVFVIMDQATRSILFVGRVVDPRPGSGSR